MQEEASDGRTNGLATAASAYLRSAMHQPVDWMEWGEAAFDRAIKEDKPILLDIGAVWCHWCHVMDRESYEDAETAQMINEHFVAVKVDRDERPDVDTRYQAAVSAISGQGGWPLTAFLTPEGKPYFGGTYFPPEDRHGRPGFQRVLLTMAEAFENRRAEVDESAGSVMDAIEHNESFSGRAGNPGPELVAKMVLAALKRSMRQGGFGAQPKFPHSGAMDLLMDVASRGVATTVKLNGQGTMAVSEAAKEAVLLTLDKMAKGGIYDHLAGGFHRYSVDEHWVVPHFEKMAYDNSELLKNYVHAYQTFGDEEFARVAREIMRWMDEWLSDRERGGFYASQDADFSLDDDGDYFTWTRDEAAEVLTPEELAVAAGYYDIGEIGDMQHNLAKNVLHVKRGLERGGAQGRRERGGGEGAAGLGEGEAVCGAAEAAYAVCGQDDLCGVERDVHLGLSGGGARAGYAGGAGVCAEVAGPGAERGVGGLRRTASGLAHVVAYGEPGAGRRGARGRRAG